MARVRPRLPRSAKTTDPDDEDEKHVIALSRPRLPDPVILKRDGSNYTEWF